MKEVLIAHRGAPDSWPENSLAGFEDVLTAGARYIETDVQLTADGIPVLSHDPSLLRVTGEDIVIATTPYETIRSIPAGYPQRFGDKYRTFRIARLDELVALLKQWPRVKTFVEIKYDSISVHGQARVVDTVMNVISPVETQCMLISFDYDALVYVREHYRIPVGWVLPEWSTANQARAVELGPEYLFCNRKRLPAAPAPLWPGPWQWAVYTIDNPVEANVYLQRGSHLIETKAIRQMMSATRSGEPRA